MNSSIYKSFSECLFKSYLFLEEFEIFFQYSNKQESEFIYIVYLTKKGSKGMDGENFNHILKKIIELGKMFGVTILDPTINSEGRFIPDIYINKRDENQPN